MSKLCHWASMRVLVCVTVNVCPDCTMAPLPAVTLPPVGSTAAAKAGLPINRPSAVTATVRDPCAQAHAAKASESRFFRKKPAGPAMREVFDGRLTVMATVE